MTDALWGLQQPYLGCSVFFLLFLAIFGCVVLFSVGFQTDTARPSRLVADGVVVFGRDAQHGCC